MESLDGEIGRVKEFHFDDLHWAIRYLVADTEDWLSDRMMLISPYSLVAVNNKGKRFKIDLTVQKITDSPPLYSDRPISRQFEKSYNEYYGMPMYWGASYKFPLETIRQSPEYTGDSLLSREYDNRLHLHYNNQSYCSDVPAHE